MTQLEVLRTPDARFEGLPGYQYEPHYVDSLPGYEGLRAHTIWIWGRRAPIEPFYACMVSRLGAIFIAK
jgi:hypothetical protein